MRAPRRLLIWLATLLAWATLGAGAGLGVAVAGAIDLGWRPLAVLSGSMAPTLETADEIVVKPVAAVALHVGNVVTFNDPCRGHVLVTHRVRDVRVAGATFTSSLEATRTTDRSVGASPAADASGAWPTACRSSATAPSPHGPRWAASCSWVVPAILLGRVRSGASGARATGLKSAPPAVDNEPTPKEGTS